jgi:hypothetical protein
MKPIATSFAFVLVFAAFGAACSSSSTTVTTPTDDGGTDAHAVTADEACTQLANAFCTKIGSCSSFFTLAAYGDVATCETRFKATCLTNLGANGTGATPTQFAACAAVAPNLSCPDVFASNFPADCQPIAGTLANDAACGDSSQCSSKFCGFDSNLATCGKCAAPPAAEAPCASGGCPNGLKCGADSKCHAPGGLNAMCDANHACNGEYQCLTGKCVAYLPLGADCDPAGTATPTKGSCDLLSALWCNLHTRKCEAMTQNAAQGATCGLNLTSGGVTICEPKSFCKITNATTYAGTCTARVADGGACDLTTPTLGEQCTEPAKCIGGKCTLPDATQCH